MWFWGTQREAHLHRLKICIQHEVDSHIVSTSDIPILRSEAAVCSQNDLGESRGLKASHGKRTSLWWVNTSLMPLLVSS